MQFSGNHFMHLAGFEAGAGGSAIYHRIEALAKNFTGQSFALTFTSQNEERFTTIPINLNGDTTPGDLVVPATTAQYIESALEGLPNGVIDDVQVDVAYNDDGTSITGTDPDTDPNFEVDDFPCDVVAIVTFLGKKVGRACTEWCLAVKISPRMSRVPSTPSFVVKKNTAEGLTVLWSNRDTGR